jgi:hypothetical protein
MQPADQIEGSEILSQLRGERRLEVLRRAVREISIGKSDGRAHCVTSNPSALRQLDDAVQVDALRFLLQLNEQLLDVALVYFARASPLRSSSRVEDPAALDLIPAFRRQACCAARALVIALQLRDPVSLKRVALRNLCAHLLQRLVDLHSLARFLRSPG